MDEELFIRQTLEQLNVAGKRYVPGENILFVGDGFILTIAHMESGHRMRRRAALLQLTPLIGRRYLSRVRILGAPTPYSLEADGTVFLSEVREFPLYFKLEDRGIITDEDSAVHAINQKRYFTVNGDSDYQVAIPSSRLKQLAATIVVHPSPTGQYRLLIYAANIIKARVQLLDERDRPLREHPSYISEGYLEFRDVPAGKYRLKLTAVSRELYVG